jgi:hypothetical protein
VLYSAAHKTAFLKETRCKMLSEQGFNLQRLAAMILFLGGLIAL